MKGVRWFTNIDHNKRHQPLDLYKKYNEEEYPKYDNYDAIEIKTYTDIPCDYDGVMGVPITFLDKYNPEQFEIIGIANSARWIGYKCYTIISGKKIYNRILIRRRQPATQYVQQEETLRLLTAKTRDLHMNIMKKER